MVRLVVFLANVLALALILALYALFKQNGIEFSLGFIFGAALFHASHRLTYGQWFGS